MTRLSRRPSHALVLGTALVPLSFAACDSGAEVAVADWRSLEARIAVLEAENTRLSTALDSAVTADDLAAATSTCNACVQPADLEAFLTGDDLVGLVTTADLDARGYVTDAALDAKGYVDEARLATYVTAQLGPYVTHQQLDDEGLTTLAEVRAQGYLTDAALDAKGYIDEAELAAKGFLDEAALTARLALYALKTAHDALRADHDALEAAMADALHTGALTNYYTKAQVDALIPDPVDLGGYVTNDQLTTRLAPYLTDADLPDLTPYALKSSLSIYALKTDLNLYALKTQLPDLGNYALRSELPNMSLYALKSDIPDIPDIPDYDDFITANDLDGYALLTDLDQFDDVIHLLPGSVTKTVALPGSGITADFTSIEAALDWADHFSVTQGHNITIQLADGVYEFDDYFVPIHRDGGRLQIIGNTGDPSKVVLSFPDGGGVLVRMGRLGLLDGVTIKGNKLLPDELKAHGVHAIDGGVIKLGDNVVVTDFALTGVRATFNGFVYAPGIESINNGLDGVAAYDGGVVFAAEGHAEYNGRHGFNASLGGTIEASFLEANNNGQVGVRAFDASSVYAPGSDVYDNTGHGVQAIHGSHVYMTDSTSRGSVNGHGFFAYIDSSIDASRSTSEGNKQNGFSVHTSSAIEGYNSFSIDNQGNGYQVGLGAALGAVQAEAYENANGFSANLGSFIDANMDNNDGNSTIAHDNDFAGFSAYGNSGIAAIGAWSYGNHGDGFSLGLGSTLNGGFNAGRMKGIVSEGNDGNGVGAWLGSAVNADGGILRNNHGDGMHLNHGAVASASVLRNNNDAAIAYASSTGNDGNGFALYAGCSLNALSARSNGNGATGFLAHNNSSIVVQDYGHPNERGEANGNDQAFNAYNAGVIDAGPVHVVDAHQSAFNADNDSLINAPGAVVEGGNNTAFWAHGNSTIMADGAHVSNITNGGGFSALHGSVMHANFSSVTNVQGYAYESHLGSSVDARWSSAENAAFACYNLHLGSQMQMDGSSANGCGWSCYEVNQGSSGTTDHAYAQNCRDNGFNVNGNATINGADMTVDGCGDTGYRIGSTSYAWGQDAHVYNCDRDGFGIWDNSMMHANSSYPEDDDDENHTIAENNGITGINVSQGSFASFFGAYVLGNGGPNSFTGGINVGQLSGVWAELVRVLDSVNGMGISAGGLATLNANHAVVQNNDDGGIACWGSSWCSAQSATVTNNKDDDANETYPNGTPEWGVNAFWNGWIDIDGTYPTGHEIDSNERVDENKGWAYDGNHDNDPP